MAIVRGVNGGSYNPEEECKKFGVSRHMSDWGKQATLAITMNMPSTTQIQICPWFLDYVNEKAFKDSHSWKTWGVGKVARLVKLKERILERDFTMADTIFLFDKLIAHEVNADQDLVSKRPY